MNIGNPASGLVLFVVCFALATCPAHGQSTKQSAPPVSGFAQSKSVPDGVVSAPEPQFHFQMNAPKLESAPVIIAENKIGEEKCFAIRSYQFASPERPSDAPRLKSYSTCTRSATGRMRPISPEGKR